MKIRSFALICVLAAISPPAAIPAQTMNPVAYPQATTTERALISWPLGYLYSDPEVRYQLLVPARFLPSTGGRITGIEVVLDDHHGPILYKALNINLAHTTASTLNQSNMPGNLPSPHGALSATNITLTYTKRAWSVVGFPNPFSYNGRDNLVIEFQKAIDSVANPQLRYARMMTVSTPLRNDLPRTIVASGALGSGAFNATTARGWSPTHLALRFRFQDTPTLTIRSDRLNGTGNVFAIGGAVELAGYAPPQSLVFHFADLAFRPPASIPPIQGLLLVSLAAPLHLAVVPATGLSLFKFPIPNVPSLVGAHVVFQSGVLAPVGPPTWTCAVDAFVNRP